jgi:hypothetical protein
LDALSRFDAEDWSAAGIAPEHAAQIERLMKDWSRDLRR